MDSILIILKKKWPKGFICPYTGTIFYNIRIYSIIQQISGERLQDHWSSGVRVRKMMLTKNWPDRRMSRQENKYMKLYQIH